MLNEDLNSIIRRSRIISGIILFIYSLTHLLNHSCAIVSIQAADSIREYFLLLWRNPISEILLFGSLIIHIVLGFYSVLTRKSFKMTFKEWLQILLPFIALFALAQHILAAVILSRMFGVDDNYELIFAGSLADPNLVVVNTILFSLMMLFIWGHGVIGIHALLSLKAMQNNKFKFYLRYLFVFKFIYWTVPILALLGFLSGLREMSFINYIKGLQNEKNYIFSIIMENIPQEAFPIIGAGGLVENIMINYYLPFLLLVILVGVFNVVRAKFFGRIIISYPGGKSVSISKGTTVLEASRLAKIPHQSVCGGKGRCTTCRIKVFSNDSSIPKPNAHEIKAIERVGLDDNVRLACQLRPIKNLSVSPLLNPENRLEGLRSARALTGKEQETVILFVDLREFTKLSEKKLPYDVVYILNKYYSVCGEIIERNGGRLDKFIGDGIMAIFDGNDSVEINCKNSILSASEISKNMKTLNSELKIDFSEEMRFGMGIHAGNTIVGMMGYGKTVSETAVGDNVNIASRLEELTKTYKSELVLSKYVATKAKLNLKQFKSNLVKIRGRKEDLEILVMENASELSI